MVCTLKKIVRLIQPKFYFTVFMLVQKQKYPMHSVIISIRRVLPYQYSSVLLYQLTNSPIYYTEKFRTYRLS